MKLPILKGKDPDYTFKNFGFRGLVKRPETDNEAFEDMNNMGSFNLPTASPRASRNLERTLTTPYGLGSSQELFYVDGTTFYYSDTTEETVTANKKQMQDFNDNVLIFPDKKYYDIVAGTFNDMAVDTPDMDFITIYKNRLWGCKGNNVWASAMGDFMKMVTYSAPPVETDSWAADVASEGIFTGMCNFDNHVVMFKPDMIHEVYGARPSQYQIQDTAGIGCIDGRSIAEINAKLYFLGRDGVYTYVGGVPILISKDIWDKEYTAGVAGTDGTRYYISLYCSGVYELFAYDTTTGEWYKEDSLNVYEFNRFKGDLYALCTDGKMYKFDSGTETITWDATTSKYTLHSMEKKISTKMGIRAELYASSTLNISISANGKAFVLISSTVSTGYKSLTIPLILEQCDYFKLKFSGVGKVKLQELYIKTQLGGS